MPRTSTAGLAQLAAEEGESLRAYRDVAGVWTIGVGLTKASGVIAPKAGMIISREESRQLLAKALETRYEPAVAAAMPGAAAHEFDGAVSFHFNTGAIGRAGWIKAWRGGDRAGVRSGLLLWSKAGGRSIEGLRRRRAREADLILDARYAGAEAGGLTDPALRRAAQGEAVAELQEKLARLGLLQGPPDGRFGAATEAAVRTFQSAHPQLTVDGIAGPATRAQIERVLAVRGKTAATSVGAVLVAGAAAAAHPALPEAAEVSLVLPAAIAGTLLLAALALTLWRYRDEIRTLFFMERKD
ncbi:lysozyme [Kaistia algarum]|uniref:glycoside hydrolase family protein n=1 Tax=Kaistia algarum TaxID=2083279 RepID=UPI000CE7565B|nr:peptidoglycan-binding protein [Kaistia algarum]MCX5512111.1 peptidoglycan-binding protein [Kaistia algarum]PPE80223.1 lysozyme [Kaistia algarum]